MTTHKANMTLFLAVYGWNVWCDHFHQKILQAKQARAAKGVSTQWPIYVRQNTLWTVVSTKGLDSPRYMLTYVFAIDRRFF
jgi:hypothetical protein